MRTILITDIHTPLQKLEAACLAGVDAIQLRDKAADARAIFCYAKKLRQITWLCSVFLFINERIDLALAVRADGVHLPEHSLSPKRIKSAGLQIGVSVHSEVAALEAEKKGADFLLFGPIYETASKTIYGPPQGIDTLKTVVQNCSIPVYGVGGIFPENVSYVLEAGAKGIAAISAFLHAPDIGAVVRDFHAPFRTRRPTLDGLLAILSTETHSLAKPILIGGADGIQFRHKGIYTEEAIQAAQHIQRLCQEYNASFFINDRPDIARFLNTTGVHVGQTDLPIESARRLVGKHKLVGGSASNLQEALAIEAAGADYIGLGHIYPTQSKEKGYPPLGLNPIQEVKREVKLPVIAIGGITTDNAASVIRSGADGVAVISALTRASNPENATQKMKEQIAYGRTLQQTAAPP